MTMATPRPDTTTSRPFVIVLTGGPCAGKTSAMAHLRDRLSKRGFQVLTVPENATHFLANSEGFQPEWAGKAAQVAMQRIFMEYQMSQEDSFKAFAKLHPTKRSILLLDCCTLNSKVYLSDEQWKEVLALPGHERLTEQQLFSRYDLVIHMVSCAFEGLYEWGPGSNNPGRYHTPEQAKECDKRSLAVFANHQQVRVVPHFLDFKSKMEQVLHFLNDALHIDGLTGRRRRRQVHVKNVKDLAAAAAQASASSFLVTSTFIDDQMENSLRRRATVPTQVWLDNFEKLASTAPLCSTESHDDIEALRDAHDVIYEMRSHVHAAGIDEDYLTRRLIKTDDYYAAVSASSSKYSTVKFVLSFMVEHNYYELFFFPHYNEAVLDMSEDIERLPEWLELTEVSVQDGLRSTSDEQNEARAEKVAEENAASMSAIAKEKTSTPTKSQGDEGKVAKEATPSKRIMVEASVQPLRKRQRVLLRYSTQEAACESPTRALDCIGASDS